MAAASKPLHGHEKCLIAIEAAENRRLRIGLTIHRPANLICHEWKQATNGRNDRISKITAFDPVVIDRFVKSFS